VRAVRVLIFHGYLLAGTGSNVYNAALAEALVRGGHEVHLLCQDRDPLALDWVDAAGDWDGGTLAVRTRREPVRATVYRPDIFGLLPLYVADRYEGFEARTFPELSDAELDRYLDANVAAVRDVAAAAGGVDAALANHLVMGPAILARAGLRYAAKIHGSALSYVVRPHPRFLPYAGEGMAGAAGVLVGSRHVAESLWETVADPELPTKTRLGPPGVDTELFAPLPRDRSAARLRELATAVGATVDRGGLGRGGAASAAAIEHLAAAEGPRVVFVGKLIVSKGVDLLLAAWPLVPQARLVVVGFGAFREGLEQLLDALAAGDRERVRAIAEAGRELEGGPRAPLRHLLAFLDGAGEDYWAAARDLRERVVLTGRLEHDELAPLLAGCEALVFPSTFPEAFGMVAAEAAACGVLPVSAGHSGAAEVSALLAAAVPEPAREWLSFAIDDGTVRAIAARLSAWLQAPEELRAQTRAALVAAARERYSWEGVAEGVIDAGQGRLDALPTVRASG
jgi:glycosyltransferase involved in cell wall biosynthesis